MSKVDDKRVHKGLMALAIGVPSGSEAGMMIVLELSDISERCGTETAWSTAFRDQRLLPPTVTSGSGSWRFLLG